MQPGALVATLGDAGASNDDGSYTGDVSTSPVSMGYFRSKVTEYQTTLNAVDQAYSAAVEASAVAPSAELDALLEDYESHRTILKTTAEALNLGAAVVNAAGGRMPELSIPQTLGLGPALPLAAVAAVATAAVLISWGTEFCSLVADYIAVQAQDTPEKAAALAAAQARARAAASAASGSNLSAVAGIVKWVAIGVGLFLVYRAVEPMLKRGD
jgi:hypothetical protein